MTEPFKRTKMHILLNLMCMAGMMIFICAIPEGMVMVLQVHALDRLEWRDAYSVGLSMTALMAGTGFVLYRLSIFLLKRRARA
jgi:hypothetical protein